MSIGLILITHNRIGAEILCAAEQILGRLPFASRHFEVHSEVEPACQSANLRVLIEEIDSGDGVLILTDLYGSTPSNIATMGGTGHATRTLAGLNLPMVLRACNYAHLDLDGVAEHAAAGGQRGIVSSDDTCSSSGKGDARG